MRTTITEIRKIISTSISDSDMTALLTTANGMVTENLSGKGLSASTLAEIEKWLTAHLVSISKDRQVSDEKLGDASLKYTGKYEVGIMSTSYGQMVAMLDTSGTFRKISLKKVNIQVVKSFE